MLYGLLTKTLICAGIAYEWFQYRVIRHDYNPIIYNLIGRSFYEVDFLWNYNWEPQKTIILAYDEYHMARFLRKQFGPIEFRSVKCLGTVDELTMEELDAKIKGLQSE